MKRSLQYVFGWTLRILIVLPMILVEFCFTQAGNLFEGLANLMIASNNSLRDARRELNLMAPLPWVTDMIQADDEATERRRTKLLRQLRGY